MEQISDSDTALVAELNDLLKLDHDAVQAYTLAIRDRKSTRLNSSHANISYAVFCLKKKKNTINIFTFLLSFLAHTLSSSFSLIPHASDLTLFHPLTSPSQYSPYCSPMYLFQRYFYS